LECARLGPCTLRLPFPPPPCTHRRPKCARLGEKTAPECARPQDVHSGHQSRPAVYTPGHGVYTSEKIFGAEVRTPGPSQSAHPRGRVHFALTPFLQREHLPQNRTSHRARPHRILSTTCHRRPFSPRCPASPLPPTTRAISTPRAI
jgi:hypothetical protein